LSSRMYLKQANHHAQIALEQYTERLSAFARIDGAPYPYDQHLYAWKLLMQNHPHDSTCGCSIDHVNREMLPRFHQVAPFAVTHIDAEIRAVLNPHELNLDQWVQRVTIEFIAEDVPACGYKAYTITSQDAMPQYSGPAEDHFAFRNIGLEFQDGGDVGDE